MSQEKAQLIAPLGNVTFSGVTATGVITATSLEGNITGSATSIKQGTSITAGVVTASSFAGNLTGNIQRLADSAPNISVGVVTATSFSGNLTGSVTDLTSQPAITVGVVTATSFSGPVTGDIRGNITGNVSGVGTGSVTGNVTGLAASVRSGVNLNVGVCTGTEFHGSGANLTGAGSTAYIAQEITATGDETIIDLSNGNLIYYKGNADTTVGFASTSAAEQIAFVRDANTSYAISYSTGGVTFDGSNGTDLSIANNADIQLGSTTEWTVEFWLKRTGAYSDYDVIIGKGDGAGSYEWFVEGFADGSVDFLWSNNGSTTWSGQYEMISSQTADIWYHVAIVRNGTGANKFKVYINGSQTYSTTAFDINAGSGTLSIGGYDGASAQDPPVVISNLRIVKGTAVYTSNFVPPSAALTNITNTKLLCCQSDSSATTAAVTPGTITANGSPTAGAQTVALTGSLNASIAWPSSIKWDPGTPTLKASSLDNDAVQIFRLTTGDTGATYQGWEDIEYVTNIDPTTFTAGTIFTWGRQSYNGVLGLNDSNNRSSPTQVGTDTTWERISFNCGVGQNGAMFAIKSDATGWVWGDNSNGQQGQNNQGASNNEYSSPTQIPGSWKTLGGDTSGFGIKTDGTLWAWGSNSDGGELGLDDNVRRSSPTQVGTDTNWATGQHQFCSSANFTQALKTDGTLWFWGGMGYGEYGHISPMNTKFSSPVQISGTNWNSIFSYSGCVMATKMDSTLWTWGHNDKGMLGHNVGGTPGNLSSPTQIPGSWSDKVFGHYRASGCIKTDGTLWTWGQNGNGALGLNQPTNTDLSSPTQVGTDTTWSTVVGRGILGGGAATKTDGTLWVWGSNSYGALGLNQGVPSPGTGYARSSPVQIPGTNWQQVTAQGLSILAQKSS